MPWSMSRRRSEWLAGLLFASLAPFAVPPAASAQTASAQAGSGQAPTRDLILDVLINEHPLGITGDFTERDGQLFADSRDLDTLGLRTGVTGAQIALRDLRGISYRLDERTQTLYITASYAALRPTALDLRSAARATQGPLDTGFGAVANYNVVATHASGQTVAEGVLDTRVFTPVGVAAAGFIATQGGGPSTRPLIRLETTYSYSDPDSLRQYQAGDFINGGLSWSRPVRLAGAQVTTNFGIRPDLVTFPVPSIAGQVAVPSSVDVLVNGVQLLSRSISSGPFEVPQLPILTGAGTVSVVVRDATGQQSTQNLSVYGTTQLLKRGLSAYSAELGVLRLNYGVLSDDYGPPAGSVTYRYGLNDWLTLEGHGEASVGDHDFLGQRTSTGGMAGGGVAFTVGGYGVVSLDAAASHFGKSSGGLVSAGFERIANVVSVSGSVQAASKGFGDIATQSGDPVPRLQVRGNVGLALGDYGALSLGYVGAMRPAPPVGLQNLQNAINANAANEALGIVSLLPATRTSLVSASYTRSFFGGRASFYATAYHDFANTGSTGAMIGVAFPFGQRGSVGVSAGTTASAPYGSVQTSQSAVNIGDFGWQTNVSAGQPTRELALGQYKSPWGLVEGGVDRTGNQTALRGDVQGALVFADGDFFATNTINDSFAVVETDHTPGIGILHENRPVGHTDSSGHFLVPDLRAFDDNRIGIDPNDVPMDTDLTTISKIVRPQDRSGVVVHFDVHRSAGAVVRLTDAAGKPLAIGGKAKLAGATAPAVPIGYDGEVFVTGLSPHNVLNVTRGDAKACVARFDYAPTGDILPTIGPVPCTGQ